MKLAIRVLKTTMQPRAIRSLHRRIAERYRFTRRMAFRASFVHRQPVKRMEATNVIQQAMSTVVKWISNEKKKKSDEKPLIVIDRFGRFSFKETLSSATVTKFYRQIVERHFLRKERQRQAIQPVVLRQMTHQLFDRIQQTATLRHYSTNWLQSLQRVVLQTAPNEERPLVQLRHFFLHELQRRTEREPQREQRRWQQQFVRMLRFTQRNPRRQSSVATLRLLQHVMRQPHDRLPSLSLQQATKETKWRPAMLQTRERQETEQPTRWLVHVAKWLKRQEREERRDEKPLVLRQWPQFAKQGEKQTDVSFVKPTMMKEEAKANVSLDQLVSRVYAEIERKMRLQRERRGR